jgi:phosphatidylinositol alpha-1,6-mannosyltransferase
MARRFLFVTRNYPPIIGGLETYSYNLIKEFETHHTVFKIVLAKSKIHLVWFLPYSLVMALFLTWKHRISHVHLCDGVLAPLGPFIKYFSNAQISISIHGLDITYRNALYQLLIPRCVANLDKIVCVSRATLQECSHRGIPPQKCTVISNGIHPDEIYLPQPKSDLRADLEKMIGTSLQDKKILTTVGRLIKRKGVAWFVCHVIPHLDDTYTYLVVGSGPEYKRLKALCTSLKLGHRVFLLGEVTTQERNLILNASDIFIMPNITVGEDVEGFGLVALEAGSCGVPVIASNIQGIRDAVLDGKSGIIVEEQNVNDYVAAIKNMDLEKEQIRATVRATFDWSHIYEQNYQVLTSSVLD